jgi:glucosylceramidase
MQTMFHIVTRPLALMVALVVASSFARVAQAEVIWITSTADQCWRKMPAPALTPADPAKPATIRVATAKTFQTIDGFGGCFNELGWEALSHVSTRDRASALQSLFGDDGCAFTLGRIPVGASDFALDAYSLDDVTDDFELKGFSISRDRKALIPFIKAAISIRPKLKFWGSPWSPPAWMKDNNHYSKGSLRWEKRILDCYAAYLARWVESYRAEGIDIYALAVQNEPNIASNYPSCLWTGLQLREFIGEFLGPVLRDRKANVELWLGINGDPPNDGHNINNRVVSVLDDPKANAFLTGIAFQYDSQNLIGQASLLYPDKKLMQSETECRSGENSFADAQRLYALMLHYLGNNASSYFMWNMVLDETGLSTWKWRQNAMISIDRQNKTLRFNGEYYVMRHFSQFVKPGAKRILTTGPWGDKIAFLNPDGSTVMVIGNSDRRPLPVTIETGPNRNGNTLSVTLPPGSINTFVVPVQE